MDTEAVQVAIDTWAIVEIFGHSVFAGKVSEHRIGPAALIRVDVPETERKQGFTKFFGPSAIFSITPCDQATVTAHLSQVTAPVDTWTMRDEIRKRLDMERENQRQLAMPEGTTEEDKYGFLAEPVDDPDLDPLVLRPTVRCSGHVGTPDVCAACGHSSAHGNHAGECSDAEDIACPHRPASSDERRVVRKEIVFDEAAARMSADCRADIGDDPDFEMADDSAISDEEATRRSLEEIACQ